VLKPAGTLPPSGELEGALPPPFGGVGGGSPSPSGEPERGS